MNNKEIHASLITIQGLVQRVGFRRFAESLARKYKLTGYVQNAKDGSVKLFVQGERGAITRLLDEMRKAPEPIQVDNIITKNVKPVDSIKHFKIKSSELAEEIQEGFGAMEREFHDYRLDFGDYRQEFRGFAKRTDDNFRTLTQKTDDFAKRTDDNFRTLTQKTDDFAKRTDENFHVLTQKTDENFKTLDTKYGEISGKLTQVLETLERESTETRRELTRAVDKLSGLVDQYIQTQQEKK